MNFIWWLVFSHCLLLYLFSNTINILLTPPRKLIFFPGVLHGPWCDHDENPIETFGFYQTNIHYKKNDRLLLPLKPMRASGVWKSCFHREKVFYFDLENHSFIMRCLNKLRSIAESIRIISKLSALFDLCTWWTLNAWGIDDSIDMGCEEG